MADANSHGKPILKYVLKALGLLLVFGTIALLLWRMFSSGDPQSMKTLYVSDATYEAWQTAEREGRAMDTFTQEYDTITRAKHNYAYFSVTQTLFNKDADEVQIIFRYNNSTIRHLKEDYGLDTLPDRDEELYDVTLVVIYDMTPYDQTDNENQDPDTSTAVKRVRYAPVASYADTKTLYNYRKFVFEDVGFDNTDTPILGIFVDVYYKGDIDYEKDSYGTLSIYNYSFEEKPYTLTGKDKSAIADYEASKN